VFQVELFHQHTSPLGRKRPAFVPLRARIMRLRKATLLRFMTVTGPCAGSDASYCPSETHNAVSPSPSRSTSSVPRHPRSRTASRP
jgi:hypothetical protein